jgi:hypothetical protein
LSHTVDEDNSFFTDDLNDSGPMTYISSLTIVNEEAEMLEEYPKYDMPGEFYASLSHNLLGVTTEDIKQFVAIQALKQMSVFQEDVAIESNGETLEDNDKWALKIVMDLIVMMRKVTIQVLNPMSTIVKWQNKTLIVLKFKVIQICV